MSEAKTRFQHPSGTVLRKLGRIMILADAMLSSGVVWHPELRRLLNDPEVKEWRQHMEAATKT